MNLILVFLLSAIAAYGEISFGTASRIRRGAGAPSSGDCAVASDVGKVYIQSDLGASGSPIFACSNSGVSSYSWQQASGGGGGGGGGATTALDNLASVNINASLIPQSAKALGAAATPWQSLYLYGSGTFGTHSMQITGAPTGTRVISLPDVTTTLVGGGQNLTTVGAIPYNGSSGILNQDASNFSWDATNHRLGIGTNAPSVPLHVLSASTATTPQIGTLLAPSASVAGTGNGPFFNFGVASSTNNSGVMQFTYQGAGSASNFINFGIYGTAGKLNIFTVGVGIGTGSSIPPNNGLIVGGTTGIGPFNASPTGTLSILDRTAGSGATSLLVGSDGTNTSATTTQMIVKAGGVQGSTNLQEWQNSSGTVLASVSGAGNFTNAGYVVSQDFLAMAGGNGRFYSSGSGIIELANSTHSDFNRLQFGGTTSSFPALKRSTTGLIARLADDSADTWVQASYLKLSNTAESTCSSTTRGEVRMVQGSTGVADTFRVCVKNSSDSYVWTALF
jgi:hypothetical protein